MALYVNWQELETKASELEGYNNTLKSECDSYEQAGLALRSSFEGDAAEEFFREVQDHKAKMVLFIELIGKYVAAMRNMASDAKSAAARAQAEVQTKNY
jgi:uncharacterized protein YukE